MNKFGPEMFNKSIINYLMR